MSLLHNSLDVIVYLKTAISGTYHACNFHKYAHRYSAETQDRFAARCDLRAMLPRLFQATARAVKPA